MNLFMLSRHDQEQDAMRELAPQEIESVFGGDGTSGSIGDNDCGDQTTCETLTVTPNTDGGWSTDCDVG